MCLFDVLKNDIKLFLRGYLLDCAVIFVGFMAIFKSIQNQAVVLCSSCLHHKLKQLVSVASYLTGIRLELIISSNSELVNKKQFFPQTV